MKVELSDMQIKAIRTALYHQYYRITNDNGNAVRGCSQEMADTTYDTLIRFQKLDTKIQEVGLKVEEENALQADLFSKIDDLIKEINDAYLNHDSFDCILIPIQNKMDKIKFILMKNGMEDNVDTLNRGFMKSIWTYNAKGCDFEAMQKMVGYLIDVKENISLDSKVKSVVNTEELKEEIEQ